MQKCMCELYIWILMSSGWEFRFQFSKYGNRNSQNTSDVISNMRYVSWISLSSALSYWIHDVLRSEQSNGLSFVKVFTVETTAPDQLYHRPVCSLTLCICRERFVISMQRFSLNLHRRCWLFHQRRWHLEKTNLFVLTDDRVIEIIMIFAVEEVHARPLHLELTASLGLTKS